MKEKNSFFCFIFKFLQKWTDSQLILEKSKKKNKRKKVFSPKRYKNFQIPKMVNTQHGPMDTCTVQPQHLIPHNKTTPTAQKTTKNLKKSEPPKSYN